MDDQNKMREAGFPARRGSCSPTAVLHVGLVYTNPCRWSSRKQLFRDCVRHMRSFGSVRVHVVELAYADRPFEVSNEGDIQLRTRHELWHKENLGNVCVRHFPPDWQYGALVDGDFVMTRIDWAIEAMEQLKHHPFVQLYSNLAYLSPQHRPHRLISGFAYNWLHRRELCKADYHSPGAVGGAWAFTRDAFDTVGGMLDVCICGSGDWHMAFGLIGRSSGTRELEKTHPNYAGAILAWQKRAGRLNGDIGYIDHLALHNWHGTLQKRGYGSRVSILVDNQYDPMIDVAYDYQGVLGLTGSNPRLRYDLQAYFRSRAEDSIDANERHLV